MSRHLHAKVEELLERARGQGVFHFHVVDAQSGALLKVIKDDDREADYIFQILV